MSTSTKFYICILPPKGVQRALAQFQEAAVPPELRLNQGFHLSVKTQPGLSPDFSWLDPVLQIAEAQAPFSCTVSGVPKQFPEGIAYLPAYADEVVRLHRKLVRAVQPPPELSREYFELSLYTPHVTVAKLADPVISEAICLQAEEFFENGLFRFPVKYLSVQMRRPGEKHYTEALQIPLRG